MTGTENKLEIFFQNQINKENIFNIILKVEKGDDSFSWSNAAVTVDNKKSKSVNPDDPYFTASITKMFTAAAIMLLHERNKLNIEDNINKYLDESELKGIHKYKGKDFSNSIKIFNLLGHTSGLGDYFEQKNKSGETTFDKILSQSDYEWSVEDVLQITKNEIDAKFPPAVQQGTNNKAFYSDTNYQLLGAILENILDKSIGEIFLRFFFEPLGLANTYVYGNDAAGLVRKEPATIYNKQTPLNIPKAMKSFRADGAIVSTAKEQIKFLKAFFGRKIFENKNTLNLMMRWNKIFFPLEYGYGIIRYKLPWYFSPFKHIPEFIGHSGASGSFSFYYHEKNLYIAGTINQIQERSLSYKILSNVANIIK